MSALAELQRAERERRREHSLSVRDDTAYAVWRDLRPLYAEVDPFHFQVCDNLYHALGPLADEFYKVYRALRLRGYARADRVPMVGAHGCSAQTLRHRLVWWRQLTDVDRFRTHARCLP